MTKSIEFIATYGYLGKAPVMPGTFGTLGAIPTAWLFMQLGPVGYMVASFGFIVFSIFVAQAYEQRSTKHDASEVVIDEVAGALIAFTWLTSWKALLAAFLLFRALDMIKPFPINLIDKKVPGGFGVVVDDLMAGLVTSVVIQLVLAKTDWLGSPLSVTAIF